VARLIRDPFGFDAEAVDPDLAFGAAEFDDRPSHGWALTGDQIGRGEHFRVPVEPHGFMFGQSADLESIERHDVFGRHLANGRHIPPADVAEMRVHEVGQEAAAQRAKEPCRGTRLEPLEKSLIPEGPVPPLAQGVKPLDRKLHQILGSVADDVRSNVRLRQIANEIEEPGLRLRQPYRVAVQDTQWSVQRRCRHPTSLGSGDEKIAERGAQSQALQRDVGQKIEGSTGDDLRGKRKQRRLAHHERHEQDDHCHRE
jgi:hypothetical protein